MDVLGEAHLALRRLAKAPAYTAAAVLSLSLAIGANSAIFSAVHAVVLRPLPVREPERLVTCWETDPRRNLAVLEVSYRSFRDWQTQNETFDGLAAMGSSNWNMILEGRGDPARLAFTAVTASFFDVLGASPVLGRSLSAADDRPGAERVVILSDGAWRRHFDSDPAALGRAITLDHRAYTVVGVMPREFEYPRGAELWTPLVPILAESSAEWKTDALEDRGLGLLYVVGRLKPGIDGAAAGRDLDRVARSVGDLAQPPPGPAVVVTPFLEQVFGPVRRVLLWLFGAVGLVLLIGCANVSGLMLTRATAGRREGAIRLALGADRLRLARAWVLEAAWLVLLGGLLGLLGARWLTSAIVALAPGDIPRVATIRIDVTVVAFTIAVCGLAALFCALAPAWHAAASDPATALVDAGRSTRGVSALRSRGVLVVMQIAMAVVLLIAAGLVVRSFANLRRLDLGFEPGHVLTMVIEPPGAGGERAREYSRELLARVSALPGVEAAGAVYQRPLALGAIGQEVPVVLEGQPETGEAAASNPLLNYEAATPGYFRAMRIPLRRGRQFDERDTARAPRVAIVGESAGRRLWPGEDPIGKRLATPSLRPDDPGPVWRTVVGVVGDVRYRGLDDVRLDLYEPSDQAPVAVQHVMVRGPGDPLALAAAVRTQARGLDPQAVVSGITTMDAVVGRAVAPWRFAVWMFVLFAALAFILATGGLFSVVALSVALRSREFAVRIALGAQGRSITHRVLLEAGRLAFLGTTLGLAAAVVGSRWLASLLFEVAPIDLRTYAGAVLVVIAATMGASLLPARRATRLDPIALLRED